MGGAFAVFGSLACRAACPATRLACHGVETLTGERLITAIRTRQPLVALTIDDGPDPATTPGLLGALARHGAHATFMLIGERAVRHPELVESIATAGHELGNHFMRDVPTVRLGRAAIVQQLAEVDTLLRPWGAVNFFRPGSGWVTRSMLRDASAGGHVCALGSPLLVRQHYQHPVRIGRRLAAMCHAGAVVVLHEGTPERSEVVSTAEAFLSNLARKGLSSVTLSELVAAEERKRSRS